MGSVHARRLLAATPGNHNPRSTDAAWKQVQKTQQPGIPGWHG